MRLSDGERPARNLPRPPLTPIFIDLGAAGVSTLPDADACAAGLAVGASDVAAGLAVDAPCVPPPHANSANIITIANRTHSSLFTFFHPFLVINMYVFRYMRIFETTNYNYDIIHKNEMSIVDEHYFRIDSFAWG